VDQFRRWLYLQQGVDGDAAAAFAPSPRSGHTVCLVGKAFVDFENSDDLLVVPQVLCATHTIDAAVHGAFKQDGSQHTLTGKSWAHDHSASHGMNDVEHLVFIAVCGFVDTIQLQCFWRTSAALI
jgi:hypothetical protein